MFFRFMALMIQSLYWLGLLASPASIGALIAFWIYAKSGHTFLPILTGIAGVCLGIFAAEYVRRRYGLVNFWSGMQASKEADALPGDDD